MSSTVSPVDGKPRKFEFGEFTYDSGSRLLTCNGVKRHLSPKAHQLLHVLLLSRPRALSRAELYDALWPSTYVCETNLAGIVKEVRCALGDDARSSQYIRTVHGFGYAFDGEVMRPAADIVVGATLVCRGFSYPLGYGENLVGRTPDARVMLPDSTISRRHAIITIWEDDGDFGIRDLDSKNGTYIDGQKIGNLPKIVTHAAKIQFGAFLASIAFQRVSTTKSLNLNISGLKRQVAAQIDAV